MAYIHKQTFDILQESNIDGFFDDYFECDDLIALPIQILNQKGYKTRFCCCGHPFDKIDEAYCSVRFEKPEDSPIVGTFKIEETSDGLRPEYKYRLLSRQAVDRSSYIVFDKGVTLPNLPKNFGIESKDDGHIIMGIPLDENGEALDYDPLEGTITLATYYHDDMSVYEYLTELIDAMRELYKWACDLPEIKQESLRTI